MDKAWKMGLLAAALLLVGVIWRGVPVRLELGGISEMGGKIPVEVRSINGDRFQSQMVTDGRGVVWVTRLDKETGTLDLYYADINHGLVRVDPR